MGTNRKCEMGWGWGVPRRVGILDMGTNCKYKEGGGVPRRVEILDMGTVNGPGGWVGQIWPKQLVPKNHDGVQQLVPLPPLDVYLI